MMRSLLAGAAVLLLAACGAAAVNPPAGPSASPAGAQLTNADSGRTVSMRVGDSVEVALRQEPGFTPWNDVHSTNVSVLAPQVDVGATAVRGMSLHRFKAAAPGTADIQATAGPDCSPGAACPALARVYRVTVIVSA